jgi:hypothetical protein
MLAAAFHHILRSLKLGRFFKRLPLTISLLALCLTLLAAVISITARFQAISQLAGAALEKITVLEADLEASSQSLAALTEADQYQINQQLEKSLTETNRAFTTTTAVYEQMLSVRPDRREAWEKSFAAILNDLSGLHYASATAKATTLKAAITSAQAVASPVPGLDLASLEISSAPPDSGYRRQKVAVNGQEFVLDIVAADLNSTRILVDTASEGTCTHDCPVLSLAAYAARNSAFAAVNGTYFCPASYPSCAGKTNSFDLLVMNKHKVYFNSDNNVYSTNPGVVFEGSSIRFLSKVSDWGRSTGIDSMLSNYPLLVSGGRALFAGDGDAKKSSLSHRPFIAAKGSTAYIGVIRSASVADAAQVLQALGMDHALNLDSGGSTAFWVNGSYKAGPGRDIPNAIVFVKK